MKYKGEKFPLETAAEEVMTFYAGMLRTDYVTDPNKSKIFNKNFFKVRFKTKISMVKFLNVKLLGLEGNNDDGGARRNHKNR